MWFVTRRIGFYVVAAWAAITVNFLIPRVMPGNAVDAMLAKYPRLDASSLHALAGRVRRRNPRQHVHAVLRLPRGSRARQPRAVDHRVPGEGHDDHRADAALDADPRRDRDDHQLHARDAARDRLGLAARRLAGPGAARASCSCRRPRSSSWRSSSIQLFALKWQPVPIRPGLLARALARMELGVRLERDLSTRSSRR